MNMYYFSKKSLNSLINEMSIFSENEDSNLYGLIKWNPASNEMFPTNKKIPNILIGSQIKKAEAEDFKYWEIVSLLEYNKDSRKVIKKHEYILPFGTIFTIAFNRIENINNNFVFTNEKSKKDYMIFVREHSLQIAVENIVKQKILIRKLSDKTKDNNKSNALMALLSSGYIHTSYVLHDDNTRFVDCPKPYECFMLSISDIFYYTLLIADKYFGRAVYIKQCKSSDCKKIFITSNNNRKYCYYPKHPKISKESCKDENDKISSYRNSFEHKLYWEWPKSKDLLNKLSIIKDKTELHHFFTEWEKIQEATKPYSMKCFARRYEYLYNKAVSLKLIQINPDIINFINNIK